MLYYNDKNHRELHLAAGDVHEVTSSEKGAVYSKLQLMFGLYRGAGKSLAPTRKETNYSDRRFSVSSILFIIITGGILVLYIYIYIYIHTHNKTNIKRNILTIKQNTSGSRSG